MEGPPSARVCCRFEPSVRAGSPDDSLECGLQRHGMARRAEHRGVSAETYLRLALKAQAQCRATIEALAEIKNPGKVVEHVREKFSCRDCESITGPPAPSHPIARGHAGLSLFAIILASKFLLHQSLNRQSATYAREGRAWKSMFRRSRIGLAQASRRSIRSFRRSGLMSLEIAVFPADAKYAIILHPTYATKKPLWIKGFFHVHES
jgi:transposase